MYRCYQMFPQCLGMDCTWGTNQEKRAMFRLIGRTADNKNIPLLCAFLPNVCQFSFRWLFNDAIPTLFGRENCQKLRLLFSDEDETCIRAFDSVQKDLFPQAVVRTCKWHKVGDVQFYNTKPDIPH